MKQQLEKIQKLVDTNNALTMGYLARLEANIMEKIEKLKNDIKSTETDLQSRNKPKKLNEIGAKCYYVDSLSKVTWETAVNKCRSIGGELVTFQSEDQFELVKMHLDENTSYWTSLNDNGRKKGDFVSIHSKPAYTNWGYGEPNNTNPPEKCVELRHEINHLMNDEGCNTECGYICFLEKCMSFEKKQKKLKLIYIRE